MHRRLFSLFVSVMVSLCLSSLLLGAYGGNAGLYSVLPTDVNIDGDVDLRDISITVLAFNSFPGTARWNFFADVDGNGRVDMRDIVAIAMDFGKHITITLEDRARHEGTLKIYGVIDREDVTQHIMPAFYKQYPWASGMINYVGKNPADIATSALSEYRAGHVTADLLINTLGSMEWTLLAGVAENYTNPMISLLNYSEGTYDPNGLWTIGYGIPIVVVYNKNLVDSAHVPTAWENLTDPFWNGKIAIDDPKTLNVAGALFAHLYPILGNASWTSLMQGIAANNPILTASAADASTAVAQGTASIGIGLIYDYLWMLTQPTIEVSVAWIPPVTSLYIPSALCAYAPHPNFAKLFLNWFASDSGQYAIADSGRVPANAAIASVTILAGVLPPETPIVAVAGNNPDYYLNATGWSNTYQSIFG